jgi:hypothetical protein
VKIISFVSTLPGKLLESDHYNDRKFITLKKFVEGVTMAGDQGMLSYSMDYEPCDVAVMLGWVHENSKSSPHLLLRKKIAEEQKKRGGRVAIADSNLFLYRDTSNPLYYLRYSFDGVFPSTGEYCDSWHSDWRWCDIRRDIGVDLQPWRQRGDHVLICLQRDGGWSMQGRPVVDWAIDVISRLSQHTRRPFRIRPHPGDRGSAKHTAQILHHFKKNKQVLISASAATQTLMGDLKNCWAVVNHNSSPTVGAAIEGIPVFVTDPENSQCRDIANTDLARIEEPVLPDRLPWVCKISQSHWSHADLESGRCWQHMRQWVDIA